MKDETKDQAPAARRGGRARGKAPARAKGPTDAAAAAAEAKAPGAVKLGRPFAEDVGRDSMPRLIFRIDPETEAAFKELEAALSSKVRGWKSQLLRRLVIEAATRLRAG